MQQPRAEAFEHELAERRLKHFIRFACSTAPGINGDARRWRGSGAPQRPARGRIAQLELVGAID
jgi:hypothetical protein